MPIAERKRASRFGNEPLRDAEGNLRGFQIQDGDIKRLAFLARRRFATAEEIALVTGGDIKWTRDRLRHARGKPYEFVKPCEEQQAHGRNHFYNKTVYELADAGARLLSERGFIVPRRERCRNFPHEITLSQVLTSFDLACIENTSLRIEDWEERRANPKTPDATRRSPHPARIPLNYQLHGVDREYLRADGNPFGLERTINGVKSYYWFPGLEIDMGTEPIRSHDFSRTAIYVKFHDYLHVKKKDIHFSHFGFSKMFIPIVTTTPGRMHSMMECLRSIEPSGSPLFLFKTFTPFNHTTPQRQPSGHMATEPWERVGHPPLNLATN